MMTNSICGRVRRLGVLAATLLTLAPLALQAAPLTSADTNGDGQISRDEAMVAQNASFKRLDENGNGALSRSEFDEGQPGLPKNASMADKKQRQTVVGQWFDRIDVNGDEKITPDEYRDAVSPYFDRLDSNHDGVITKDEIRSSFEQADKAQQDLQKQP